MNASKRGYVTVSAIVFALVALFQLWRAASGWPVAINRMDIPVAASFGIAAATGLLAIWGWRSR